MTAEVSTVLQRPENAPRLEDFQTAMRYGRYKRDKLYSLIAEEKVVAYKDGHTTLVDLDSIDKYKSSLPRLVSKARKRRRRRR